jgi:hypothetical protein
MTHYDYFAMKPEIEPEQEGNLSRYLTKIYESFQERPPDLGKIAGPDELRLLKREDGLRHLAEPPALGVQTSLPPRRYQEYEEAKYLWAIKNHGLPFILEKCDACAATVRGKASHTNLTGGSEALCGGEMWFGSETKIYLDGGSGRYPPREPRELEMVAEAIKDAGYEVISFGWEEELNRPARFYRGTV